MGRFYSSVFAPTQENSMQCAGDVPEGSWQRDCCSRQLLQQCRICREATHRLVTVALFWLFIGGANVAAVEQANSTRGDDRQTHHQSVERAFSPYLEGEWIGAGISYGPYRVGQSPGGKTPSRDELVEDLEILTNHWKLMRMYGAVDVAEEVLQIVHTRRMPIRVMLGAWITRETESESLGTEIAKTAKQANEKQVAEVIRLANSYPDEVVAVSVGNETQVYWSDHITKPEILIQYIRQVREATSVPVTTADDFNFWNKPESHKVAAEIDFIVTHIHALWAGLLPSTAMPWTEKIYDEICKHHPNKVVVIGEAGWATQVHDEGEQAKLIKGEASEATQQAYYEEFTDWARQRKICTFFFDAFDEPWKGGAHPDEVEKHWGLFNVDRTPKAAMRDRK